ncbi:MAG: type II secretion system F family protein [Candidatus Aenigmarchaeota archaeon]|nr:type II secretion system F family protein [Candidatus Aenigmarchaeota archaeon]
MKFKIKMNVKTISAITITVGAPLLLLNFLYLSQIPQLYAIVNLLVAVVIVGVPLLFRYSEFKKIRKIEEIFPRYLNDIAENISAGMTLPQAIRATGHIDYGVLSPYVKEMAAKVTWGITFEKIMEDFAKKTGSRTMRRNVQTIIETHRSGGSMDTVLKSVGQSLIELERIKKERSASVYAQMINGYLIYIVFLGVMIGLSSVLVPAFRLGETLPDLQIVFVEIFRALIVIQGFFAGLSIGKMAEGTLIAGIKHSIVLVVVGYSAFLLFG